MAGALGLDGGRARARHLGLLGGDEPRTSGARLQPARHGITHSDVDHLMIHDAPCSQPGASFAHLPIYGLEDLGFVTRGEAGAFIADRNTAPGSKLPLNTNGGGLSYSIPAVRHVRASRERAPDARHRPRPDPRRQDLGLPRCGRRVRRLRHDHHVERAALAPRHRWHATGSGRILPASSNCPSIRNPPEIRRRTSIFFSMCELPHTSLRMMKVIQAGCGAPLSAPSAGRSAECPILPGHQQERSNEKQNTFTSGSTSHLQSRSFTQHREGLAV